MRYSTPKTRARFWSRDTLFTPFPGNRREITPPGCRRHDVGYVALMADVEDAKGRTDRQLIELLTELRVALPGAQVLLGFLLTAPLASRFGRVSDVERA